MNLVVSGKDFPITPSIRQYVAERVAHLTHRAPEVQRVHVELDVDHHHQKGIKGRAEVWVEAGGMTYSAGAKAESVRAAVDLALPKVVRQLSRKKDRALSRRHGHHGT